MLSRQPPSTSSRSLPAIAWSLDLFSAQCCPKIDAWWAEQFTQCLLAWVESSWKFHASTILHHSWIPSNIENRLQSSSWVELHEEGQALWFQLTTFSRYLCGNLSLWQEWHHHLNHWLRWFLVSRSYQEDPTKICWIRFCFCWSTT